MIKVYKENSNLLKSRNRTCLKKLKNRRHDWTLFIELFIKNESTHIILDL